ncbi:hypothetical protein IQ249_15555 [Lusitaniella coriacea LEGE 07157]|uniref:Tetratricopeptide repeat protein n=1 Tax=Lusitaniella coriacea LEGE 07157 TaxID=945747 RepID=A0A8J7E0Z3_9CYAN|nr:hypothetical protein [Lusitaniella coriacea]MBE9117314.1 hypothetical protein [Lusitaniella coriacea LEGE 07157]
MFASQDTSSYRKYEAHLQAAGEEPLDSWAKKHKVKEAYRFTYLPSFDPPEILRSWRTSDKKSPFHAVFKLGSEQGKKKIGAIEHEASWNPSLFEWTELLTSLDLNFWTPMVWKGEFERGDSEWIFEGYRQGEYKRLRSWRGRNPMACTLGRAFRYYIPARLSEEFACFRSLSGDRLGEIIYEYLEAGQLIKALQLAQRHKSDYIKVWLFESHKILETWADLPLESKLALLVQSVETAQAIDNQLSKAPILRDLALKYVVVGQLNRALQVAQSIGVPYYKVITLDYLCDCYAETGRMEEAASIRTRILLAAQQTKGDPAESHLSSIVDKHTRLERLEHKLARVLKSWLPVKMPE